jgi:antitoxin component of MazEF toxin-antitoxin module
MESKGNMPLKVKLRRIGNAIGVTIPRPILYMFNLKLGDHIFMVKRDNYICLMPQGKTCSVCGKKHKAK